MISHVYVGVTNFDRALLFYSAVMAELDLQLKFAEPDKSWAGWTSRTDARPLFLIGRPFNGQPHAPGNGQMIALLAPSRAAVDKTYATAREHGAADEGAPGQRPHYHPNYYGAYFRDLDGNKLCICCHH